MTRAQSHRGTAGFTLAELVVATTLISIVMAGVYTALSSAINAWKYGETNYEVFDDARYALGLMARELQNTPPASFPWFIGTSNEIEFFTLSSPLHIEDGVGPRWLKVRYRLAGTSGRTGKRLIREEQTVEGSMVASPDCEEAQDTGRMRLGRRYDFELAANVQHFQIQYHWQPPIERSSGAAPPPKREMFTQNHNEKCWGMPKAVGIALSLKDPSASAEMGVKSFENYVVFRGASSGLPQDLAEQWFSTHR